MVLLLMSLMFMPWKRELTSHNSFLSIFFPSLFSHFTRDFVGDFDILMMLKGGLKGDGEGRRRGGPQEDKGLGRCPILSCSVQCGCFRLS
jgi:hypothetical protein